MKGACCAASALNARWTPRTRIADNASMPLRPPVLPNLRQPLCPNCEYNLTGVFDRAAMRPVTCPECGETSQPGEMRWTRKEGDWTLAMGARKLAVHLLLRGLGVAAILAMSIIVVEGIGHGLQRIWTNFPVTLGMLVLTQVLVGIPCGKLLMRGIEDAAGFMSVLLPLSAAIMLALAGVVVAIALPAALNLTYAPARGMSLMACMVAGIAILIEYMSDAA